MKEQHIAIRRLAAETFSEAFADRFAVPVLADYLAIQAFVKRWPEDERTKLVREYLEQEC